MNWYFVFFVTSGFCSVLYELVWLRLSMAQFGVTTAMVSIVLSVFMAGLGLGSWASGHWLRQPEDTSRFSALRLYALIELLIGVSGILVPYGLLWGRRVIENAGLSSSFGYYMLAGLWVSATLLPWCALMGATVPVAMRAIGQTLPAETSRSFSYLYMANVCGAVAGTHLASISDRASGIPRNREGGSRLQLIDRHHGICPVAEFFDEAFCYARAAHRCSGHNSGAKNILGLLFLSGLTCMAMEVVWVRGYTPYYGTMVYAFASILGIYLLATFIGSVVYRRWSSWHSRENPIIWSLLAATALFPLLAASPAIELARMPRLALGIAPFTGVLGFITPMLVDRFSGGNPGKAGTAYATNIVGCILGPLLAGFGLLPFISERWALIVLTLPWLIVGLAPLRPQMKLKLGNRAAIYALMALAAILIAVGKGYDEQYPDRIVRRDSTATVIATGEGMDKELLVNGYGMTSLTPITKVMAHLPLAFLDRPPQNALVICFGMGTTFRALRSWGIPVTAAELVPSVPRVIGFYHADGPAVLASPLSHVVIDDGRRFLERTTEQFDVITIDPPPPVEAAGSSLLYSEEFYQIAKRRLRPGGILQQWFPDVDADLEVVAAVARSLRNSFPYVRTFQDDFGFHFLCSEQPLPGRSATELLQRLPPNALIDFTEWADPSFDGAVGADLLQFQTLLAHELPLEKLIALSPNTPALTDDRPINEYYVVRRTLRRWRRSMGR